MKNKVIFMICMFFLFCSSKLLADSVDAAKCRENRRTIAGAIEIYYIEYPETYGMITIDMLLRSGALSEMVYCPSGGEYSIDANGEVYCSVHYKDPASVDNEENVDKNSSDTKNENGENNIPSDNNEDLSENKGEAQSENDQLTKDNPFVRENELADESKTPDEDINLDDFINVKKFKKAEEKLITAQDLGEIKKKSGISSFFGIVNDNKNEDKIIDRRKNLTASEYNERGLKYAFNQKFDFAIKDFQSALDLSPDSKIYLYNLALTYARSGNLEMAKDKIRRAKRLNPKNEKIGKLYNLIYKKINEIRKNR